MPLTPLTEDDLEMILPWRNAPAVRRAMYTHHEISMEEHRAWFARMEGDQTKRWLIYRDAAGEPQGVVYFVDIDAKHGTAFWGFYARPGAQMGSGLAIALAALDAAFEDIGLHKVNGEVLKINSMVLNLNRVLGFTEEGRFREAHVNADPRIDVVRFGMLAAEWPAHRARLVERIAELDRSETAPPHTRS